MRNFFSVMVYFEESEGINYGDKAIYVFYKNELICNKLFKEIKDIKEVLEEIYSKFLVIDPSLKIIKGLNYLYFKWLEDTSKLKKPFYKERVS